MIHGDFHGRVARPRARRSAIERGHRTDGWFPPDVERRSIHGAAPQFTDVEAATRPFLTGIKAFDLRTPLPQGGKVGVFGGAGVGKTVLIIERARRRPHHAVQPRAPERDHQLAPGDRRRIRNHAARRQAGGLTRSPRRRACVRPTIGAMGSPSGRSSRRAEARRCCTHRMRSCTLKGSAERVGANAQPDWRYEWSERHAAGIAEPMRPPDHGQERSARSVRRPSPPWSRGLTSPISGPPSRRFSETSRGATARTASRRWPAIRTGSSSTGS
jgi:hypothetical protein